MLKVEIPGRGLLELEYLLLDYNGTLALDGELLDTVSELLHQLAKNLKIYILTADTFGRVRSECSTLPVQIQIVGSDTGDKEKGMITRQLGAGKVVAIGNGYNDQQMLQASALGILVIGSEGCAVKSLLEADIVCKNIEDALKLLLYPKRLIATLRK